MMCPDSEADLAEAIRSATGPIRVQGGGTRPVGSIVEGDLLSTKDITGIELYEPGAMTLVTKAGTAISDIEGVLAKENQQLAFEPMDHRTILGTSGVPTIGGVVAGNVSGPRRLQVGACRDHLLGVRYVDGRGQVVSNGGRVMKNVTGYDLVKLMAGSRGTLGVLSEVSLKVMPKAEASRTVHIPEKPGIEGLKAMTWAMGSPFDVSGAAQVGDDVYLRVEGFEGSVAYRSAQLQSSLGGEILTDADKIWRGIRDVEALKDHAFVWKVAMTPSAYFNGLLAGFLAKVDFDSVVDWAGGCVWVGLTEAQAEAAGGAHAFHDALQAAVADPAINNGAGGHATLIKGPDELRSSVSVFQPEVAALAVISAGLTKRFDPRGILNAGLMA